MVGNLQPSLILLISHMENQILACQAIYAGRNIWVLVMLAAENMVNGPPLSGWIYGPRGFLYMNRYQYSIHSFLILPSRFASCRVAKTCRKSRSLLKGGIAHVSSIISWKSIIRLDAIWLVVPGMVFYVAVTVGSPVNGRDMSNRSIFFRFHESSDTHGMCFDICLYLVLLVLFIIFIVFTIYIIYIIYVYRCISHWWFLHIFIHGSLQSNMDKLPATWGGEPDNSTAKDGSWKCEGSQISDLVDGDQDSTRGHKRVCLKIVYPFLPNGFADHYPISMAISLGI